MTRQNTTSDTYNLLDIERKLYSDSATAPMVKMCNFFDNNNTSTVKMLAEYGKKIQRQYQNS